MSIKAGICKGTDIKLRGVFALKADDMLTYKARSNQSYAATQISDKHVIFCNENLTFVYYVDYRTDQWRKVEELG